MRDEGCVGERGVEAEALLVEVLADPLGQDQPMPRSSVDPVE